MLSRRQLLLSALAPALPSPGGSDAAVKLLGDAVEAKTIEAAVLYVQQGDRVMERSWGLAKDPAAVFLLASLTKPFTAAGVIALCEKGRLELDEPVSQRLPELLITGPAADRAWRAKLTLRHLLAHTSGLPDVAPGNDELRRRRAPLGDYLSATLKAPLAFAPGSRVRYQSMGYLMAATIAERTLGQPFRDHLANTFFVPLGMSSTSLGLGGRPVEETMKAQVPDADPAAWNTPYWRDLGAPWGGAHGTAADVSKFLRFFARPRRGPIGAAAAISMLTLQTPAASKERYGLGWRLGGFGPGTSEKTFGHTGSTGVLAWCDPKADRTVVILTTLPAAQSEAKYLRPASALIAGRPGSAAL